MMPNDMPDDRVLAALRELRAYDVSPARAQRLRTRCHRRLGTQDLPTHVPRNRHAGIWPRTMTILAAAWCVVYLAETIRRAAAVYGF